MHQIDPVLTELSGSDIVAGVTAGRLSPEAVTEAFLKRAAKLDPELGTYVTLDAEGARATAQRVSNRLAQGEDLPLAGLPITIKDQYCTKGLRTTGGSRVFFDFIPAEDAPFVARLRAAGAIILGKTVTPEFGMFWRAGAQVGPETRNPWDQSRTPGGSSAGSAAGVAARLTPVSIGADGAGSIRLPAAYCGIAGLMPTLGRIPRGGGFDGAQLFTQVGPMARRVADLALLLDVLQGADPSDPHSLTCPPLQKIEGAPSGLRLAFWDSPGAMAPDHDPRVLACAHAAAGRLADAGHSLTRLDPPIDTDDILPHFRVISGSDRLAFLGEEILSQPDKGALLGPHARETYAAASLLSATDYARSLAHRQRTIAALTSRFDDLDLILSPTAGTTALPIPDHPTWRPLGYFAYTFAANYTGFPALTLPCGLVDGLPVGLQLIGPPGSEPLLLGFGSMAEGIFGYFSPDI